MSLAAQVECPDENQLFEGRRSRCSIGLARYRTRTGDTPDNRSAGDFTGPGISPRYISWRRGAQLAGRCQAFRVGLRLDTVVWDRVILGRE